MKRRSAVLGALLVLATATAACGGGGDDEEVVEDETAETTAAPADDRSGLEAKAEEGEDVFADYIEALLGGSYDKAMELSKGPAADIAGYFNAASQITSLPAELKAPSRQVKLRFNGEGASESGGAVVLNAKVDADITGGGLDEQTTYTGIKLEEENGKLVVVDFARGENGPVSEDVLRTSGATGEADGVSVDMGPGYAMRGAGAGGTLFANVVFSFKNSRDSEVNIKETSNNKLYYAASLDTSSKRYYSSTSAGNAAAPGARGIGFVMFNDQITATSGTLTLTFVGTDEMDDEEEIKVQVRLGTL